ncbi:NAD(+) synthase [Neorhodopirellula pilleata]|uniref:Glutamine-dependent NAD(+) synthetase n=1 Tax=Neorhodopirellula pilleata TaxID=2714738 RepID=A0A5C6A1F1_9BACT|nr:NAD(+) synthase [Neorhodopirellula pilleata]TWT93038.1 Glutamine-dependent NAD(+) synthetase [Neorhodopirellula pilleata]
MIQTASPRSDAFHAHGYYRATAAGPRLKVADPAFNANQSIQTIRQFRDSDLIVLPELGLTAYTCGDLFATRTLLDAAVVGLHNVVAATNGHHGVVIIGLPLTVGTSVMNVAAVIGHGQIYGIVPKTFLPTYREFYEGRHFRGATSRDPSTVEINGTTIPFGTGLLFEHGHAVIAVEICEDLWVPVPPSSHAAIAGANVVVNLSASNETIGKAKWRHDLVVSQSGRLIAGYVYASAGGDESTSDVVFGGHCLIAENGTLLGQSRRIGDGQTPVLPGATSLTRDLDLQRLDHDRRVVGSFDDFRDSLPHNYRRIPIQNHEPSRGADQSKLLRRIDPAPFVPDNPQEREARCAEILAIQTGGLVKRLSQLPESLTLSIGVSGGLDSTLALLIAAGAVDHLGRDRKTIDALVMPGFGTTRRTNDNAMELAELLGVRYESIDIRQLSLDTFVGLKHSPLGISVDETTEIDALQTELAATPDGTQDLVFENVQARMRTLLLMSRGFVLGTGDLSEQALGWSTYNGDHMSMYNVNASIPKTLVRYLVRYFADHRFDGKMRELLHRIADTPISPELLPPNQAGEIRQSTEASLGAYELHDFFLYHFVRGGCDREKMLYLAKQTDFESTYRASEIEQTLDTFIRRFFANQFKRNCVPDGPKVGSVSLSPRGDWRMPPDASDAAFRSVSEAVSATISPANKEARNDGQAS